MTIFDGKRYYNRMYWEKKRGCKDEEKVCFGYVDNVVINGGV